MQVKKYDAIMQDLKECKKVMTKKERELKKLQSKIARGWQDIYHKAYLANAMHKDVSKIKNKIQKLRQKHKKAGKKC